MDHKKIDRDQFIKIVNVLTSTLDHLQSLAANKIGIKYKKGYNSAVHRKNGSYSFIPFSTRIAVAQIIKAYDLLRLSITADNPYPSYKFLDAGCGIGNIMLLAGKTGFNVYGLEIDPTIIRFVKEIGIYSNNIIKQNILTFKHYNKYDVIYFYRPIINGNKQARFENRVKDQMKQGAILIPNLIVDMSIKKDSRFKEITIERFSHIYQKIKT
jgi:2-polyprenyl-3-methyl-5-hydroxy-6-metoxy-1,4-benzoquinol methylase